MEHLWQLKDQLVNEGDWCWKRWLLMAMRTRCCYQAILHANA
ncbi:hypothetical protein ACNKHT_12095 [Shigella flexneri]